MTEFPGFPWKYGMDFSEGRGRVIAVRFGDGDIKSDLDRIGPVVRTAESDGDLGCWARRCLSGPVVTFISSLPMAMHRLN